MYYDESGMFGQAMESAEVLVDAIDKVLLEGTTKREVLCYWVRNRAERLFRKIVMKTS